MIDNGDLPYMHAASSALKKLDSVHHASLHFISHWYIFIYKAMLSKLREYLSKLLSISFYLQASMVAAECSLLFEESGQHSVLPSCTTVKELLSKTLRSKTFISFSDFNGIIKNAAKEGWHRFYQKTTVFE